MADIKKEQEREELHKAIWNIANDLRGSVDGWDFKQYVLGIMFYRYISENIANYIDTANMPRETLIFTMPIYPTKRRKRREPIWWKLKASLFFRANFS